MTAIAARTGQIINYATVADQVGVSEVTIKEWISILEKSGIVYTLKPYTSSVLKRTIKTPKLYFRDTGLCSYLTRWLTPGTLKNGAMAGAIICFVDRKLSYVKTLLLFRYGIYERSRNHEIPYRYANV